MKVKVVFTGLLRRYIGEKEVEMELPDKATAKSLAEEVARLYRESLPENLFAQGMESFYRAVRVARRGESLRDLEEELREGDEIIFLTRLAGG